MGERLNDVDLEKAFKAGAKEARFLARVRDLKSKLEPEDPDVPRKEVTFDEKNWHKGTHVVLNVQTHIPDRLSIIDGGARISVTPRTESVLKLAGVHYKDYKPQSVKAEPVRVRG